MCQVTSPMGHRNFTRCFIEEALLKVHAWKLCNQGLNSGRALPVACCVLCQVPAQEEHLAVGGVATVHGDVSRGATLVLRRRGGRVIGAQTMWSVFQSTRSSGGMWSGLWVRAWSRETSPAGRGQCILGSWAQGRLSPVDPWSRCGPSLLCPLACAARVQFDTLSFLHGL